MNNGVSFKQKTREKFGEPNIFINFAAIYNNIL